MISKQQSEFANSREFYFPETSHLQMRSFVKMKPSRKFLNLHYVNESYLMITYCVDSDEMLVSAEQSAVAQLVEH